MTTNTTTSNLVDALTTALKAHHRAKTVSTGNTFESVDLEAMADAGLDYQDLQPAINKAPGGGLGRDMEEARVAHLAARKADTGARRKAEARARAERKAAFERVAEQASHTTPDASAMQAAWLVVLPLYPTIMRAAESKRRWADRYLGDTLQDVPQMAMEKMATMLAGSDYDLDALHVAAEHIAEQFRTTGQIAGDQVVDKDAKRERKAIMRDRKLLMGVINNRVNASLVDAYRDRNKMPDSLDVTETILAHISQPGDDPITVAHKASRAPSFMGTRFTSPGDIDRGLVAQGIAAAITDRGLDALAEFLLSDEARRVDGSVAWSEHAETIFNLTPGGLGPWLWQQVVAATSCYANGVVRPMDRARKARGDAARAHVRSLFQYLDDVVRGLVDAFDFAEVGRSSTHFGVACMASVFEGYLPDREPGLRKLLQPALKFDTPAEAAQALLAGMASVQSEADLLTAALA